MDVKEKTKMESSSLVICEHFSGTNIFFDKWNCTQNTYKNIKACLWGNTDLFSSSAHCTDGETDVHRGEVIFPG